MPLRAGTDIMFLGALINYVLENDKYFREYVSHYTNASDDHSRRISRYRRSGRRLLRMGRAEEEVQSRDPGFTRARRAKMGPAWRWQRGHHDAGGGHGKDRGGEAGADDRLRSTIPTLQNPNCVFQILQRHFARYTPELVEQHAAFRKKLFLKVAETFMQSLQARRRPAPSAMPWDGRSIRRACRSSARPRSCNCCWATSAAPAEAFWRCAAMRPFRVRPISPRCMTFCPGYLPMPFFESDANELTSYIKKHTADSGLVDNFEKYFVSLMKSWYGDNATAENELGFDFLPRVTGDHSHFGYWLDMAGRQGGRAVRHGAESGGGSGQWTPAALCHVEAEVAGGSRHCGDGERLMLVQTRLRSSAASLNPKRSRPKYFSSRLPDQPRKTAARPTRSAWCSSMRRQWIRPEMPQRNLVHASSWHGD